MKKIAKKIATGLSLPKDLKDQIDKERGDIPRSKYILRMLQRNNHKVKRNRIKKHRLSRGANQILNPVPAFTSTKGEPIG